MIREVCLSLARADTGSGVLDWWKVPLIELSEWIEAVKTGEKKRKRPWFDLEVDNVEKYNSSKGELAMRIFKAVVGGLLDGLAAVFAFAMFLFLLLLIVFCFYFVFLT